MSLFSHSYWPSVAIALLTGFLCAPAATFVVDNKNDSGAGSLRQAILDANGNPGRDTITFNISAAAPLNIMLASELPAVTDALVIDATTQPGYSGTPLVGIVGLNIGAANGLTIQAYGCEVRGLAINRFKGDGLRLDRGGNHVITANFFGTTLDGSTIAGNRYAGLTIYNSANNVIGGTNATERNLISGNQTGVYITGLAATNNVVLGNLIGTDVDGLADLGNTNNGVLLYGTTRNKIGGSAAGARNVISGNNQSGVYLLDPTTTGNQICGNFIGTTISGMAGLSNKIDGVTLYDAPGNLIGGSAPGEGNVISANRERGIYLVNSGSVSNRIEGNLIGLAVNGTSSLGNRYSGVGFSSASYNCVGGTNAGARNIISGNQQSGVAIGDAACIGNSIIGNFVGPDKTGTNAVPNAFNGVVVSQGTNNVIGGSDISARNVISGNTQVGVYLQGGCGTRVIGNLIGPDATGRVPLRNRQNGVRIECAGNFVVAALGREQPLPNVISGNGTGTSSGVLLNGVAASNNVIAGNMIGLAASGTVAMYNTGAGIGITNAPRNLVGGTGPFDANVISGNLDSGIYVSGNSAGGNRICGNLIGTDVSGTAAVPNVVGGIYIYGAPSTLIGGTTPGAANVISGNAKVGISIGDAGANNTLVQGNYIGLQRNGTTLLGNQWHGIELISGANTIVGGVQRGAANRIAGAQTVGYDGVRVRDTTSGNVIRGNSIFANGSTVPAGLGIDLGVDGVTANDTGDGDAGANGLQNFPILTSANGRYITVVAGTLNSQPNASFTIDFYGNVLAEPSGYGEGERWLGSINVSALATGNAAFAATFTNFFGAGNLITATATDSAGNTSEFSPALAIVPAPDSDGDGLPDDYELASGLNTGIPAAPGHDSDGDGSSDLQEFIAGTNAGNAADAVRLTVNLINGATAITITTTPGKTYELQASDSLTGPWMTIASQLAGTGSPLRLIDTTQASTRFYRATVTSN